MKVLLAVALLGGLAGFSVTRAPGQPDGPLADRAQVPSSPLPSTGPGDVMAFREVTLKAGVDPAEFERFVAEEFTPTFERHVPGVSAFIMKGTRGDRKDGYAFVLVFDSERTRDFYFPTEHGGEASVRGAALELWRPGQQVILERLMEYVDGISETGGYTDYLVLG